MLVSAKWEKRLATSGYRILQRYPEKLLISGEAVPDNIPGEDIELLEGAKVFANGQPVDIPTGQFEFGQSPRTLVRFIGPVCAKWRMSLTSHFIKTHFWCPPRGACLELPQDLRNSAIAETLPFISGCQAYTQTMCSRRLSSQPSALRQQQGLLNDILDVVCFHRDMRQDICQQLEKLGATILSSGASKVRMLFMGELESVRKIRGVKLVDFARVPVLAHTDLHATVGVSPDTDASAHLTGKGQVIAVADTGLDTGKNDKHIHEDFRGRIRSIISWPIAESWVPFVDSPQTNDGAGDNNSGHGTHVAGLALGNGKKSAGKHQGAAPEAELVFQAIEQYTHVSAAYRHQIKSGFYLSGRPMDLRDLFQQAKQLDAHIHVNAWGDPSKGQYTDDCYESDMFLYNNPDAVVLFAAGNSGADRDGNREIDRGSIYSPACAKNVIAVGATEGGNPGVGLRRNWRVFDPKGTRFKNRRDAQDRISGEPERIALISSAGPSRDGRIKPDICAPGTNLAAPKSSLSSSRGWGIADPAPHYMYNGGTSMSVGVTGGCAALVRQAWQEKLGAAPSGVALKALLIHGAQAVLRRADDQPEPAHVAGFGRVSVEHSIHTTTDTSPVLLDFAHLGAGGGIQSGEIQRFPTHINNTQAFRATLTWYDPPGERLINNLNLCLVDGQGKRVWGNHPANENGQPDHINTVERIHLEQLEPGSYELQVIGVNIPQGPQGFALVRSQTSEPQPRTPLLQVRWLRGIGSIQEKRLMNNNINSVRQLLSLNQDQLQSELNISVYAAQQLKARLLLLQRSLKLPETNLPIDTSLYHLLWRAKPVGIGEDIWLSAKLNFLPLALVFDKASLKRITLEKLR